MGSNYFGDERGVGLSSSSSQSSSRKGKKNGSDKPKQPQRGLGVAQLEKIRLLQSQNVPNPYHLSQEDIRMQSSYPPPSSSSYSYSTSLAPYHAGVQGSHGVMMEFQDLDRASLRYGQSANVTRWHPENARTGSQHFVEPNTTRYFFGSGNEESLQHQQDQHDARGLTTQNSESNDIDLELRL